MVMKSFSDEIDFRFEQLASVYKVKYKYKMYEKLLVLVLNNSIYISLDQYSHIIYFLQTEKGKAASLKKYVHTYFYKQMIFNSITPDKLSYRKK